MVSPHCAGRWCPPEVFRRTPPALARPTPEPRARPDQAPGDRPLPQARWTRNRWLALPVGVHWETRAPSAVDTLQTSIAKLLTRLTRLPTPPPWSTTRHCWLVALESGCWVMSAPLLAFATWSTRPLWRARIRE